MDIRITVTRWHPTITGIPVGTGADTAEVMAGIGVTATMVDTVTAITVTAVDIHRTAGDTATTAVTMAMEATADMDAATTATRHTTTISHATAIRLATTVPVHTSRTPWQPASTTLCQRAQQLCVLLSLKP